MLVFFSVHWFSFLSVATRAVVYKALFWPRLRVCRDCFYSLSDRRSYERCEGARKTVVIWACELLYCHIWCFGISAVQSCRKYRNRLFWPYFYCLVNSLTVRGCLLLGEALYWRKKKPGNHLSKRVHVRASRGLAHIGVAVRVLIWTVSAWLWVLAEDVIAETFAGWSSNTLPSVFWPSQVVVCISI